MLKLRQWYLNDVQAIVWLTSHADYRYMDDFLPQCLAVESARSVIMSLVDLMYFVGDVHQAVEWDGRVVGGVGVSRMEGNYCDNGLLRCMLLPEMCGHGIGTEVIRRVVEAAASSGSFHRLTAQVFDPNSMAVKVLEKNGFVHEGTKRRAVSKGGIVYDELIYGMVW